MKISSYGKSDLGLRRTQNEDAFLINDVLGLYVVCDGLGGHAGGEVASAYAIEKIDEFVSGHQEQVLLFHDEELQLPDSAVIGFIEEAIQFVADALYQYASLNPQLAQMGTTLTAVLVLNERVIIGHVGDCRCYLIRDGKSSQLTDDHTLIGRLLQRGMISRAAARKNPQRHVLSQSLGSEKPVHIDTMLLDLAVRDRFILCSDGLTDYLEDHEQDIQALVRDKGLSDAVDTLINFAKKSGGKDNITVVV